MNKLFVLIAAAVAVVGLGAAVAAAREPIEVGTSMTFHIDRGSSPSSYFGDVKAKKDCQKRRRVVLRHDSGVRVGSDRSNAHGRFEIVQQRRRSSRGRYGVRAHVRKKRFTNQNGDTIVCEGAFGYRFLP